MSVAEISEQLNLTSIKDHGWHIQVGCHIHFLWEDPYFFPTKTLTRNILAGHLLCHDYVHVYIKCFFSFRHVVPLQGKGKSIFPLFFLNSTICSINNSLQNFLTQQKFSEQKFVLVTNLAGFSGLWTFRITQILVFCGKISASDKLSFSQWTH